jgi:O-antigen/teichoic acid export membrane protein
MSIAHRIVAAVSAMWLSRFLGIATSILVMPVLFRHLPRAELGTWFMLAQCSAVTILMDLGVTSTLTRRIAFARGAGNTGTTGALERDTATSIAGLLAQSRLLYRCLAGGGFVIASAAGWVLFRHVDPGGTDPQTIAIAWIVLCAGYAITVGTGMWTAVVSGLGYVAAASILSIATNIAMLVIQAAAVLCGGGLIALAATSMIGSMLLRVAMQRFARAKHPEIFSSPVRREPLRSAALIAPSLKYWLTEVGAVLLLRTDQLFIAGFQDTSRIPAYFAAYTLIYNLALLSLAVGDSSSVYLSQLWRERSPESTHAFVLRSTRIGLGVMLSGSAFLLLVGDSVIAVWVGTQNFVGNGILATFCLTLTLYVMQSLVLGFSRATENEIYAPCYLAAGALKVLFTWALVGIFGLWGIALGTLAAQLLTTNWYVVKTGLRRLQIPWPRFFADAILPAAAVFGATMLVVALLAVWNPWIDHPIERVAAGVAGAGIVCLASIWLLVLDEPLRRQVRQHLRARLKRAFLRTA